MAKVRTRLAIAFALPLLLAAVSACDIVTAKHGVEQTAEWRKTYQLQASGRVEIANVNGKIEVQPSADNTVEVVALKTARAGSADAARQALERIEIAETSSPDAIRIETRVPRGGGFLNMGRAEVRYTVKVPAAANVHFSTVNGGIEVLGLRGRVDLDTTNGGIRARDIAGPIEASTTNGGVDVDVTRVSDGGVSLACTNGGITLRLPSDARATISASVANGGIDTRGLAIDATETSRRRLEGRLNGGGAAVKLEGTNGGIRIASR